MSAADPCPACGAPSQAPCIATNDHGLPYDPCPERDYAAEEDAQREAERAYRAARHEARKKENAR